MKRKTAKLISLLLAVLLVIMSALPAYATDIIDNMAVESEDVEIADNIETVTEKETPVIEDEKTEEKTKTEEDSQLEEEEASPAEAEYEEIENDLEDSGLEEASPSEVEEDAIVLTWADGDFLITLKAPDGAFDGEVELRCEPIVEEELNELIETAKEEGAKTDDREAVAYDVKVVDAEGNEVQPKKPVILVMEEIISAFETEEEASVEDVEIYHFNAEGKQPEKVKLSEATDEEGEVIEGAAEMEFEHFSPLLMLLGTSPSSIGDLWTGWDQYLSDEYKPLGSGTEDDPYTLVDLANLMWMSTNIIKGTAGVSNAYYIMVNDIDMSGMPAGFWHPIGWYKESTSPKETKPFEGHFDGCGYTISGLDLICNDFALENVGLFGVLEDAVIKNVAIEADTVAGYDNVGILVGQAKGKTEIHNVTVSGSAFAGISVTEYADKANVGGIVGCAEGTNLDASTSVILEDCKSENVQLNAEGDNSCVGGIVGAVKNAYIVDSTIDGNSIKGKGYVGGIAGQQTKTNIYNSYIDTTVGSNGSDAAGGITGKFVSGEIYLVQFNGEIASTNKAVTHEGIVVGTRDTNTSFVYGTNSKDECGYVFFNQSLKGKAVSGSGIDGDATGFTKSANIGFWDSNELKYTLMEGSKEYPCGSTDYFYEELENGVRYIVVQKLGKQFSVQDYAEGLRFSINHYAAGPAGSPVLGYLVSVPQINSVNSADLDVAYMTALAGDGSLFYKAIDKASAAAVAPGTIVKVITSAKNDKSNNRYFQRVVDPLVEPEHVKRPTYTDSTSGVTELLDMDYQTGGSYTFEMPACDTELNCEYEKVHSAIELDPDETTFYITATRTGDRKNPQITWRITDDAGHLLADNIVRNKKETDTTAVGFIQSDNDVNPIDVEAIFSSISVDNKVEWTIDDPILLNIDGTESGFTAKNAKIKPEILASANTWLYQIVSKAESDQKSNNYVTAIDDTEYTKTAVLTATTDPDHSVDNISAYARCNVTLNFKIIDQTTLWTEGVSLDKNALTFNIVRRLTGDRRNPTEKWEVTGLQDLKATVTPAEAYVRSVTWEMTGPGATSLLKAASGEYDHDLSVESVFKGSNPETTLPDWMLALYSEDNAAKAADKNYVMTGQGTRNALITVTATDKQLKVHTATCSVTVNYKTIDTTPDVHRMDINTDNLVFTIQRNIYGKRNNPNESYTVTTPQKLSATLTDNAKFLEDVIWTTDANLANTIQSTYSGTHKSEALVSIAVNTSNISSAPAWIYNVVNSDNTAWNNNKSTKRNGSAQISGYITVKSNDVTIPDGTAEVKKCKITVNFQTNDTTTTSTGGSGGGGGGGGGGSSSGGGGGGGSFVSTGGPASATSGKWTEVAGQWVFIKQDGTRAKGWLYAPYTLNGKTTAGWFLFDEQGIMRIGLFTDTDGNTYYFNPVRDSTYGVMQTGWITIGGYYYYFNEKKTDSMPVGAMYRNTTTPDGSTVDAQGRKVAGGVPVKVK